jgi:hypothetical protein
VDAGTVIDATRRSTINCTLAAGLRSGDGRADWNWEDHMKKLIIAAAACFAVSGSAFAAEPAHPPRKCCCEAMKEAGKDCCAEMKKGEHDGHAEHGDPKTDTPKR